MKEFCSIHRLVSFFVFSDTLISPGLWSQILLVLFCIDVLDTYTIEILQEFYFLTLIKSPRGMPLGLWSVKWIEVTYTTSEQKIQVPLHRYNIAYCPSYPSNVSQVWVVLLDYTPKWRKQTVKPSWTCAVRKKETYCYMPLRFCFCFVCFVTGEPNTEISILGWVPW